MAVKARVAAGNLQESGIPLQEALCQFALLHLPVNISFPAARPRWVPLVESTKLWKGCAPGHVQTISNGSTASCNFLIDA